MTNPVSIEKHRTALVFIEFQNEWLGDDSILFKRLVRDEAPFREAASNAAHILATAREEGWTIAHAGLDLRHDPHYRLFAGGHDVLGLRSAIPGAGTWIGQGAAFSPPFLPERNEFVTQGRSGASVLRNSTLDPFLRNNRIDTIVLMGFATHVCVESTLREAHDIGLDCWIVTDGCAAFTKGQHDHVVEHVLHHFGAGIDTATLARHLKGDLAPCSS
ncbi:cysteine hydrolase [Burkholderia paludis]|uniref:cysteine hydrolase n=1 Tax=Burkholderia paludis TaxID=1506587 RepID=UPI00068D13A5|nr:cysteine hydrolase [Burkholderia paludis]